MGGGGDEGGGEKRKTFSFLSLCHFSSFSFPPPLSMALESELPFHPSHCSAKLDVARSHGGRKLANLASDMCAGSALITQ